MSTSLNANSSYATAMNNWRRRRDGRGFPKFCRKCGEGCEIFTSKTSKNPGRLFHGCPNGSEEDKNHLFKWIDVSLVEEVEDLKILFDEKIAHLEPVRCEDEIRSYGKNNEDLTDALAGFKKEMEEMKELVHGYEKKMKNLKKMAVCGVGMMIIYHYFAK